MSLMITMEHGLIAPHYERQLAYLMWSTVATATVAMVNIGTERRNVDVIMRDEKKSTTSFTRYLQA
jgi:hypothetical protein